MEETKNAELVEEEEKKLRSKNLIIHGVEESSSDNKDADAIKSGDIYIKNVIAALKVTSTLKRASRIGLPAKDKNRPIKVVMNTEEERSRILSNLRKLKDIQIGQIKRTKKIRMNHLIPNLLDPKVVQKTCCDSRGS